MDAPVFSNSPADWPYFWGEMVGTGLTVAVGNGLTVGVGEGVTIFVGDGVVPGAVAVQPAKAIANTRAVIRASSFSFIILPPAIINK